MSSIFGTSTLNRSTRPLAEEALRYHDIPWNRAGLELCLDRLTSAEAIVMQFATWCFGMPAMLKGFCDRLLIPGVAFDISDPAYVKPSLQNLRRIVGVVAYGRRWDMAKWMVTRRGRR
jgi:putative NADPH-quinone reductase